MLFCILLCMLELVVFLEGYLTFQRGFFMRSQGKTSSKKIGYFIEHVGMWGDVFIVSPLIAYLISQYYIYWSWVSVSYCLAPCLMIGAIATHLSRQSSYHLDDSFNEDGRTLPAGWLHIGYTVVSLTAILLYYFGTPRSNTREHVLLVTGVLSFHLAIGILIPPLVTYNRLRLFL